MHHNWDSAADIQGKDVKVAVASNDNEGQCTAVAILHLNHLQHIRRQLLKNLASFCDGLKLALFGLNGRIVEVEELACEDCDTDCLLMIKTDYESDLVLEIAHVADLLAAQADLAGVA